VQIKEVTMPRLNDTSNWSYCNKYSTLKKFNKTSEKTTLKSVKHQLEK